MGGGVGHIAPCVQMFTSFQLALPSGGKPTAFDSTNGMCCVASSACMTFYSLSNPGTPAHVIYNEPMRVDKVKMQKQGSLIAALRAGAVSFWNAQSGECTSFIFI